jgi:hypothetical protein
MKIGKGFTLVVLALGLSACASRAQVDPKVAALSGCQEIAGNNVTAEFYRPGQVYAAREVERTQFLARAIQRKRTVGAELYMHAPQNVTGEFLERALACHAHTGQAAHPNDPLHPSEGAVQRVSVRSAGGSFAVQVIATTPEAGREIWARARAFASGSNVDVKQVATSGSPGEL